MDFSILSSRLGGRCWPSTCHFLDSWRDSLKDARFSNSNLFRFFFKSLCFFLFIFWRLLMILFIYGAVKLMCISILFWKSECFQGKTEKWIEPSLNSLACLTHNCITELCLEAVIYESVPKRIRLLILQMLHVDKIQKVDEEVMGVLLLTCSKSLYFLGDSFKKVAWIKGSKVILVIIISNVHHELVHFDCDSFLAMSFMKFENRISMKKDKVSCCIETLHDWVEETIVPRVL